MLKTAGVLQYNVVALAGAGGAVTFNLLTTDDGRGNHFANVLEGTYVDAHFTPHSRAASGNGGLCFVSFSKTVVAGVVTAWTYTVTNHSAGAGDTVTGTLHIAALNPANFGL